MAMKSVLDRQKVVLIPLVNLVNGSNCVAQMSTNTSITANEGNSF